MKIILGEQDLKPGVAPESATVWGCNIAPEDVHKADVIILIVGAMSRVLKERKQEPLPNQTPERAADPEFDEPTAISDGDGSVPLTSDCSLEEWANGRWSIKTSGHLNYLVSRMIEEDDHLKPIPRRITRHSDSHVIAAGRHCPRDTPINDIKAYSIVMSLDKPGPRERDGGHYHKHVSPADAKKEARRLSMACGGGRFGVLTLVHVTGWVDTDVEPDEIPF